ncbi:hypothetical protein HBI46_038790 [Parastagonospora nodorum]|nr:hypothetical protein HBI46_038790 [Parastagonospora nodorum]
MNLALLLNPQGARKRGNADCVNNNNNNIERTALPAKRIKTNKNRKKSTHPPSQTGPSIDLTMSNNNNVQLVRDNIEKLICVGKVKHTYVQAHTVPYPDPKKYLSNSGQQGRIKVLFRQAGNNRNNLNIIVTDPTSREFSRVNIKSSTRLSWTDIQQKQASEGPLGSPFSGLISITLYIYVLRSVNKIRADVADVFNTVVSKSDKVPTREPSSHIKTELYPHQKQDYSAEEHDHRKFYRLVITGEDTHYKQTIKKAYIMLLERALLILFIT